MLNTTIFIFNIKITLILLISSLNFILSINFFYINRSLYVNSNINFSIKQKYYSEPSLRFFEKKILITFKFLLK